MSRALDVPAAWRLNVHAVEIGNGNWLPEDAQPIRTSAAFAANRVGHRKAGDDFCTAAGVDRRTCVICTQEVFARTNRRLRHVVDGQTVEFVGCGAQEHHDLSIVSGSEARHVWSDDVAGFSTRRHLIRKRRNELTARGAVTRSEPYPIRDVAP